MNVRRISQALEAIESNEQALSWLNEFGASAVIDGEFRFNTHYASACNGYAEGVKSLTAYGRSFSNEILEAAKRGCKNTIEISRQIIREEANKE